MDENPYKASVDLDQERPVDRPRHEVRDLIPYLVIGAPAIAVPFAFVVWLHFFAAEMTPDEIRLHWNLSLIAAAFGASLVVFAVFRMRNVNRGK